MNCSFDRMAVRWRRFIVWPESREGLDLFAKEADGRKKVVRCAMQTIEKNDRKQGQVVRT